MAFEEMQKEYGILNRQPENINPLLINHHRFMLRRLPTMTYFCQSTNLPGASLTITNQHNLFTPIKRPSGNINHDLLMINFAVDENLKNWREIFEWMRQCADYENFDEYQEPKKHFSDEATLLVLTNKNNPAYRINFSGLFPLKLAQLNFDSKVTTGEFLYCEASFAFSTLKIEEL